MAIAVEEVMSSPPVTGDATVEVRARTAFGDITVRRSGVEDGAYASPPEQAP